MKKITIYYNLLTSAWSWVFNNEDNHKTVSAVGTHESHKIMTTRFRSYDQPIFQESWIKSFHEKKNDLTILTWPYTEDLLDYSPGNFKIMMMDQKTKVVDYHEEYLPESCGGCLLTNNPLFNQTAKAIHFDLVFLFKYLHSSIDKAPNPFTRDENQIWFGWFRESAAKGAELIEPLAIFSKNKFNH